MAPGLTDRLACERPDSLSVPRSRVLAMDVLRGESAGRGFSASLLPGWDQMCAAVADVLSTPLPDPFIREVVVVPGLAHRRHLSQQLAASLGGADGVCAGIDFPTLVAVRRKLDSTVLGLDPALDPWRTRGLALALVEALADCRDEPWFNALAQHLRGDSSTRPGRRVATAGRIAKLFRRYCALCPDMIDGWTAGAGGGPQGEPLGDLQSWQPELWRVVRARLSAVPDPVDRQRQLLSALGDGAPDGLPPRLQVLSIVGLPSADVNLLRALSLNHEVLVWQLAGGSAASGLARNYEAVRRAGVSNLALDLQLAPPSAARQPEPDSLLRRVQAGVRGFRKAPGSPLSDPSPDASIQVHSSHGPDRQVEVLREVLCAVLADDPTLEPRDIVVQCTDLASYAPLIAANFCLVASAADADQGLPKLHPAQVIRAQLAQATIVQDNPVIDVLMMSLDLDLDRCTVKDLLGLCLAPPIARRFGLEGNQQRIAQLLQAAQVRWGVDQQHRRSNGLDLRQGTWLAGVERMLVGVALGFDPPTHLGGVVPLDQVESSDLELVGRLSELIARLRRCRHLFAAPAPLYRWVERLLLALDDLVEVPVDQNWQLNHVHSALAELTELGGDGITPLAVGEVRALLTQMLRPRTGRANYGNGSLLFCQLGDTAAISSRVVCVLGLDDQHFPGRQPSQGDDLTRWLGGPDAILLDPRAQARQHLLDALLQATDKLVVITQGFDEQTNEPIPAPVPILDLMEACAAQVPAGSDGAAAHRETLLRQHTLQPQGWMNFAASGDTVPFSFDRLALAGATAQQRRLQTTPAPEPAWLWRYPRDTAETFVELHDIIGFLRHPARSLLRQQAHVALSAYEDELCTDLPIELDGLQRYQIGDRVLTQLMKGTDPLLAANMETHAGTLPPCAMGAQVLDSILHRAATIARTARPLTAEAPHDIDLRIVLGREVVTGRVRLHGHALVSHSFAKLNGRQVIESWLALVALAAGGADDDTIAVLVNLDGTMCLRAPAAAAARGLLADFVALRRAGLRQLVPLPIRTAAKWSGLLPQHKWWNLDHEQEGKDQWQREADEEWRHFGLSSWSSLMAPLSLPGDPGHPATMNSRFQQLADWCFLPIKESVIQLPAAGKAPR